MTLKQRGRNPTSNRIIVFVLAVAGIAGWGTYISSSLTRAGLEERLRVQTAALQDYRARYATQLQKAEEIAKEAAGLRNELSAVQSEMQRLSVQAEETGAELAKARDQLAAIQQTDVPLAGGISTEILRIKPRPTKQDVMAAQEALTQLRFGALEADGVIGPSTRQAIEEFQRAAGLQVTGELHAQTLLALTRAAKVMAAQNERLQQPL